MMKKIINFFKKKQEPIAHERRIRDLLRENLATVAVDVFYYNDPLLDMNPEERREYLLYFYKIVSDKKLIERIRYFINKQANITLKNSKDGTLDTAGCMKMDGMGTLKDDFERLSQMFLVEEEQKKKGVLDPKEMLRI